MGWNDHLDDGTEISNLPPEAWDRFSEVFDPNNAWLKFASREDQTTAMDGWFRLRYCDPAHETPYNGREGYMYIHGGPYDPADVLHERFGGCVPDDLINELVEVLHDEVGSDWAPINHDFDFDPDFDLPTSSDLAPLSRLKEGLRGLLSLEGLQLLQTNTDLLRRLVFSGAIAEFEAFLWGTVQHWALCEHKVLRNIVTKIPEIAEHRIPMADIFQQMEGLETRVKAYLQQTVWHRMESVGPLLRHGLEVQIPGIGWVRDAITKRHDIVHRAGQDAEGNTVVVTQLDITVLCQNIERFGEELTANLQQKWRQAEPSADIDF